MRQRVNSFLASGETVHLLITFANSLEPDHSVILDLVQNGLTLPYCNCF